MGKVVNEAELVDIVARERAAGRTIALANGCFDLLHVGHVRYLEGAKAESDRLIVGVNDDRSVASLKGPGRPILAASDRAELVAALRAVDYVIVFADPTVARLLPTGKAGLRAAVLVGAAALLPGVAHRAPSVL